MGRIKITVAEPFTAAERRAMERWEAALLSDRYVQVQNTLHNPKLGGFCCLGVACDLEKRRKGFGWLDTHSGTTAATFSTPFEVGRNVPPEGTYAASALAKVAITTSGFDYLENGVGEGDTVFATLNDMEHWTFRQIARLVRRILDAEAKLRR